MIIDVCTYHWRGASPWYSLRGGRAGGISGVGPTGVDSLRDDAADGRVILGYASNHLGVHVPYESIAARVAREDRSICGFAGIDPLDERMDDSLASALELGAAGVVVSPADQDCRPTNERFMELMERCDDRRLPVMVTNPGLRCAESRLSYACPSLLEDVAGAFPRLTLILGELRMNRDHALLMVSRHENVYAETSSLIDNPSALHATLLSAHHMGVTEKFLFGSGAPFFGAEEAIQRIFSINKLRAEPSQNIPRERLRAIVERDVRPILRLDDAPGVVVRSNASPPVGTLPERAYN